MSATSGGSSKGSRRQVGEMISGAVGCMCCIAEALATPGNCCQWCHIY